MDGGCTDATRAAKDRLRRTILAMRRALAPGDRAEESARACGAALARADVRAAMAARRTFAAYLATPEELDASALVAALRSAGATVAVPRWDASARAYELAECGGALRTGPAGIAEPDGTRTVLPREVAVWFVPGLAFTPEGARLGYGGGWYDRFLAAAAPDAKTIGLAFGFQIVPSLPEAPHDRRLTAVVAAPGRGGIQCETK